MDINQSKPRPETCTLYNCGEKGHLSWFCKKPWKQQIWLAVSTEVNLKSLVAKVVAAALDTWKRPRRICRLVNGETHTPSDQ